MNNSTWRKQLAIWRNRLYLYPAPDPMPHTRLFWFAMGLVALAALLFASFFILFLIAKHNAYLTAAEDMGIMDQAVWTILHGQPLHQTICNIVSDTNCYSSNGISRFAIHFEPILFLVSLFYIFWPGPNTLVILQTLIVASGAFPAFWLARLRLRNELAAVGIALLYLFYPAQQQATIFEFHAVTFTAAFLLFTLYFMYTRRSIWLFIFAILSMACKEEIPLVIAVFGLWSIVFQHRWPSGLGLVVLAVSWLGVEVLSYHIFSPTGHPLLASRYAYLGNGPVEIARNILLHPVNLLKQHVLGASHRQYLRVLLGPASYLPLLAPWVLVLAVPSLALNLFSSDPNQYLGVFHYSAEIVPVLIFATIEAIVVMVRLFQWVLSRLYKQKKQTLREDNATIAIHGFRSRMHAWLLMVVVGALLLNMLRLDTTLGAMPYSDGFGWPQSNAHTALAQRFIGMIPPSASVSAQSSLVPHISQRNNIYLFPYADDRADYIFLDVTSTTYPYTSYNYTLEVKNLLLQKKGNYGLVAAQDGYLLLKRGLPAVGLSPNTPSISIVDTLPNLPNEFCSFTRVSPQQVTNPVQVNFTTGTATVSLVGFSVVPPDKDTANLLTRYMQVTAYWKVSSPNIPALRVLALLLDKNGKELFSSIDFPAISWCPTSLWQPGNIFVTSSSLLYMGNVPTGLAHVGLALLPLASAFGTIQAVQDRLPLRIVNVPKTVASDQQMNTVLLDTFTIVP